MLMLIYKEVMNNIFIYIDGMNFINYILLSWGNENNRIHAFILFKHNINKSLAKSMVYYKM